MKKVNFQYKHRPSVRVLRNMNLHCPPGSKIALVGPSGKYNFDKRLCVYFQLKHVCLQKCKVRGNQLVQL
jgi:ABC-type transport system involved in cytochrome bd biosynthesis fused ATPase/permease subunit